MLGGVTNDPNAHGSTSVDHPVRKPSWFAKLTKRQDPSTSLTTIVTTDPHQSSRSNAARTPRTPIPASTTLPNPKIVDGTKESLVDACRCCGTMITYPADSAKIKCSVCRTVVVLISDEKKASTKVGHVELSYRNLKQVIYDCKSNKQANEHERFKPLFDYLKICFGSYDILNRSFRSSHAKQLSVAVSGINLKEVRKFYYLLMKLPNLSAYYLLLSAANSLLSRPLKFTEPDEVYWLLILLELPTLSSSVTQSTKFPHNVKAMSYEILKRLIGILGYSNKNTRQYLCHWFAKLSNEEFSDKVDLVNLYISFQLTRCINQENHKTRAPFSKEVSSHVTGDDDGVSDTKDLDNDRPGTSNNTRLWPFTSGKKNLINSKIKLSQYGNDWHLRSAGRFLGTLFASNTYYRSHKLPTSLFYNTMADYVNVRQDFDAWQYNSTVKSRRHTDVTLDGQPSLEYVVEYLQTLTTTDMFGIGSPMSPLSTRMRPTFTFCQHPFLLSLGAKISILEYEAKKEMERKAEEAFISSLQKKIPVDVYFRLRVRRSHITNDSLNGILLHQSELKKSLRVEFINEVGIDAGGLKKEWFMLLSRELFDPKNGLFTYSSESQLGWFSYSNINNNEMYYLVGVIMGLAIYNSTILGLQFPQVFYKKLLGKKSVNLDDYTELHPVTGSNLTKLLHYPKDFDFESLGLFFEVSYRDLFGELHTHELIEGGSNVAVTAENRMDYIHRYINLFLNDLVKEQFESLKRGADNVMAGNALSLFDSQEIELILTGDDSGEGETFLDVSVLRAVTKYQGGLEQDSDLVSWFWEYIEKLTRAQQKQLLLFVTGTDRLPATGIQALVFKVTLLKGPYNRLPLAHTCFNELCLFQYPSKEVLWSKLSTAISESEGFGIK